MKKIILITECLEKGVGKHVLDLYTQFKMNNNEVLILYGKERFDINILNKIDSEDQIKLKELNNKIGFSDVKCIFEIIKIIKKFNPDVVHCHSSKAGVSGRIAAKICGVKKILYSPHAYYFLKFRNDSFKKRLFVLVEKILSKCFTHKTITTSKGEDEVFEKFNLDDNNKKVLIEHGVELKNISKNEIKKLRKKYGVEDDELLVGAMARFENQKDPIGVVKIMNSLVSNNKKIKCIFWGTGTLYEEALKVNQNRNVIIPGETLEPEICLESIDLYLTSSLYEGLPYTILQCLGLRKVVVASNVEGNKDCVFDGVNGFLFESGNYAEAVEKIENVLNNCSMKEKMEKESKKIFDKRFSMDKMKREYRSLYLDE